MAKKLSKREAAYREKQKFRPVNRKSRKLEGVDSKAFAKMLKDVYPPAFEFFPFFYSKFPTIPLIPKPKTPEELDAYLEAQEELQLLEEEDA